MVKMNELSEKKEREDKNETLKGRIGSNRMRTEKKNKD